MNAEHARVLLSISEAARMMRRKDGSDAASFGVKGLIAQPQ
jgi:hypothetical protein